MLKKATALVLMIAFVIQTFSAPFVMLDYYSNTAAYAKNCINKATPAMHCNGKCQAMIKIREKEKQQQENAERFGNLKLQALSTKSFYPSLQFPQSTIIDAVKNAAEIRSNTTDRSLDFFHPPQAV